MKFSIKKNQIVKILSKIQGLAGKNSNLAITENILIEAQNDHIIIKATDLETEFEGLYFAKVEKEGSLAVNAKKMYEILKYFPENDILIEEIKNNKLRISNSKICYNIVCNDSEDFPEIKGLDDCVFFTIESLFFRDMLKKTLIISSLVGEKRAHINGVLLDIDKDKNKDNCVLRMVSTDANRLSVVTYEIKGKSKFQKQESIIIPKKGLGEVIKFVDTDELLEIGIKENIFVVKKETETIVVRLLEGEFPEYKAIIKKRDVNIIKLNKNFFIKTIKRMSILTNDKNNGLLFTFANNKMIVRAKNAEFGESKEEVEINFSGEKINVAFNPNFLLDTLSVMEDVSVQVNIVNESKPCIIEGSDGNSFISVIMPMRI